MSVTIRDDLVDAHRAAWDAVARPGSWWTAEQRLAIARIVRAAIVEPEPSPPWVPFSSTAAAPVDDPLPAAAIDVAYRIARHAGTITEQVAAEAIEQLGALPYVELCGVVSSVAAVATFHRNVGAEVPPFPDAIEGDPTHEAPAEVVAADLNWVPVAAPADQVPAVLQAYSAVPIAQVTTWHLAEAQYMTGDQMVHADFMRRADGLTRPEAELIAARVAQLRECFY